MTDRTKQPPAALQPLRDALGYLDGARFANYSGQIIEQGGLIVCEIGCACSEIAPKRADEYAEALISVLNGAREALTELDAYEQIVTDSLQSVWEEMRDGATFKNPTLAVACRIALKRIDRLNNTEDE